MRQQYDANPWGWNAAEKRSELAHDDARFVLVRGGGGAIQAFAHFRFDVNDEDYASRAVLYVRELQVAEPFRGAGLGRRVMGLLQRVAEQLQLDCIMLTVFKSKRSGPRVLYGQARVRRRRGRPHQLRQPPRVLPHPFAAATRLHAASEPQTLRHPTIIIWRRSRSRWPAAEPGRFSCGYSRRHGWAHLSSRNANRSSRRAGPCVDKMRRVVRNCTRRSRAAIVLLEVVRDDVDEA